MKPAFIGGQRCRTGSALRPNPVIQVAATRSRKRSLAQPIGAMYFPSESRLSRLPRRSASQPAVAQLLERKASR